MTGEAAVRSIGHASGRWMDCGRAVSSNGLYQHSQHHMFAQLAPARSPQASRRPCTRSQARMQARPMLTITISHHIS